MTIVITLMDRVDEQEILSSLIPEQLFAFGAEKTTKDGCNVIALLKDESAGNEAGSPLVFFRSALSSISGDVFLRDSVYDGPDSRPHARTRAHCAGFVRGVEHEVGQIATITARYVFERFQLNMLDA